MSLLSAIGIAVISAGVWEAVIKPFVLPSSWYYQILKYSNFLRLMFKKVKVIRTKKSFELKENSSAVESINSRLRIGLKKVFKEITFIENTTPYIIEAYVSNVRTTITIEIELEDDVESYPRILIVQETKDIKFRKLTDTIKDHIINIERLYGHMSELLEYDEGIKVELELTGKTLFDYFFKVLDTKQVKIGANITLEKIKEGNQEINLIKMSDIATPDLAKKVQELVLAGAWFPLPDSS